MSPRARKTTSSRKRPNQPDRRRSLPSVERLIEICRAKVSPPLPHLALVQAARQVLAETRKTLGKGANPSSTTGKDESGLAGLVLARAQTWIAGEQQRVINATGVPLHTNLGRAPLADSAREASRQAGSGYLNLEYDLKMGRRSVRGIGIEAQLRALTGAESALVVNNNAAAVLLALTALAEGERVLVSRGELIEIGGSYRLPDVFEKSGAILHEVGTTNRTHLRDYERALTTKKKGLESAPISLVLRAHPSNYRTIGFTTRPELRELVQICHRFRVPLVEDLGSGALVDLSTWGIEGEPTVQQVVQAGADLVCFSGDKLLGGPQAGIMVGRRKLVQACRKDALARAVRVDKQTLAALEATLALYFDPVRARQEIPVLRMLSVSPEELEQRAKSLARALDKVGELEVAVKAAHGEAGGGSLPVTRLPTWVVTLKPKSGSAARLETDLRGGTPPVIARVQSGRVWLDVRTLIDEPQQEVVRLVVKAVRR